MNKHPIPRETPPAGFRVVMTSLSQVAAMLFRLGWKILILRSKPSDYPCWCSCSISTNVRQSQLVVTAWLALGSFIQTSASISGVSLIKVAILALLAWALMRFATYVLGMRDGFAFSALLLTLMPLYVAAAVLLPESAIEPVKIGLLALFVIACFRLMILSLRGEE